MDQAPFEETMRKFLRRKPFHPFVVELLDGNQITVAQSAVAMGGGAASMLVDDTLVEFVCEEVREIRLAPAEAVS